MSSVSPYSKQCLVGDSHNINNDMRAADGSGDTLGLQEKAPSTGWASLEDNLVFLSRNFPRNHY